MITIEDVKRQVSVLNADEQQVLKDTLLQILNLSFSVMTERIVT